jgi:hypothetical protein
MRLGGHLKENLQRVWTARASGLLKATALGKGETVG